MNNFVIQNRLLEKIKSESLEHYNENNSNSSELIDLNDGIKKETSQELNGKYMKYNYQLYQDHVYQNLDLIYQNPVVSTNHFNYPPINSYPYSNNLTEDLSKTIESDTKSKRLESLRRAQAIRRLDPDYRKAEQEADRERKRIKRLNPEYRKIENAKNSLRNRLKRNDPIYRAAEQKVDAIRKRIKRNDPEYRKIEQERNNIRSRLRRLDPSYREAERIRSANRKRIKRSDPEYRRREQELDRERKLKKKFPLETNLESNKCKSDSQSDKHKFLSNINLTNFNNELSNLLPKSNENIINIRPPQFGYNQETHSNFVPLIVPTVLNCSPKHDFVTANENTSSDFINSTTALYMESYRNLHDIKSDICIGSEEI